MSLRSFLQCLNPAAQKQEKALKSPVSGKDRAVFLQYGIFKHLLLWI
jgi:hypothetical protein